MEKNTRVTAKLFMGVLITSEMKMHLHESALWRNAKVMPDQDSLQEVCHEEKNYIGFYLPEESIQLKDLKQHEATAAAKIHNYAPNFASPEQCFFIFPQLFVR